MKIDPSPIWTPTTLQLGEVLGFENLRAVGGCVRDHILGQSVSDIDFACALEPAEILKLCRDANLNVIETGISYGTVTVMIDGISFEVTSLRSDIETDGRHAQVTYTKNWGLDAARRDFTINALYCDYEGQIYDKTGKGLQDLKAPMLRFIGDPAQRIKEDYLRVLRLFRFKAQLSGILIEDDTIKACRDGHVLKGIKQLSRERITSEFQKLLLGRGREEAIELMINRSEVGAFLELSLDYNLGALEDIEVSTAMLPAIIIHLMGDHYHDVLRLPKRDEKIMSYIRARLNASWQEMIFRSDHNMGLNSYIYHCLGHNMKAKNSVVKAILSYVPPDCPVSSKTFIDEGFSGRALGEAIENAKEEWVRAHFDSD